jgi:sugar O-acyltransferase (sialic acid O-acetyltransferase NeuD family)
MARFGVLVMKKALIGNGGHAREVMCQIGTKLPCFVDNEYLDHNSVPLSNLDINKFQVMIAIADPIARLNITQRLPKNTNFFTFIHPTALLMDKNSIFIGEGSVIGAYSILTTNIQIGKHAILNRSVQIGHDCYIGNYFSAMPGAIVSGNCTIGNCVYLGTNSSIKQNIHIKDRITLGLNSGLVSDIKNSGIYGGVPAVSLKKK